MTRSDDQVIGADPAAAGVPQDVTLVEVLGDLAQQGYRTEFSVDADGLLCCRVCGICVAADAADLQMFRRLEGASDPGDMAAVLAVRCAACASCGTAVVRFGPEAGPGDAALLASLGPA